MNLKGIFFRVGLLIFISAFKCAWSQPQWAGLLHFSYQDGQAAALQQFTDNHGGSGTFRIGQMTMFVDSDITENIYFTGEIQSDLLSPNPDQNDFRIRSAAVTATNIPKWKTNIQIGRFNTVFGSHPDRRLPLDNYLFDAPLAYTYRVNLDPDGGWVPNTARQNTGDFGVRQLSLIDKDMTQTGIKAFGRLNATKLHYAFSLTNNPPSNPRNVNINNGVSTAMKLNWIADHSTDFGFSYAQGGYLNSLDAVTNVNNDNFNAMTGGNPLALNLRNTSSYQHYLYGFHWNWRRSRYEINSEIIMSSFQVPNNTRDLDSQALYIQGKYNFTSNFFGAARYDVLDFNNTALVDPANLNIARKWDDNVKRFEVGVGSFLNPSTLAKFTYQNTDSAYRNDAAGLTLDSNLVAGTITVIF